MSDVAPAKLDPRAREGLERVLALLAADPRSLSSVREPNRAWEVHVSDSLAGLEVDDLARAAAIADLGAGAGFPGLPLAAARPRARVDLIESNRRKADFIAEAIAVAGLENARAVGPLAALAELAAPLLREGGALVAWKGGRDADEERELAASARGLAMAPERVLAVRPFEAARSRHLHVVRKVGPTPHGLPRRPGVASKRARSRRAS